MEKIDYILLKWYESVYKNHTQRKLQVEIEEELARWIEENYGVSRTNSKPVAEKHSSA